MEKYSTPAELLVSSFQNPVLKNKLCLVDSQTCRAFSYADMEEETALAAGLLKSFHIEPGDTVSLLLENGLHFFFPWIGAMRIGAKVHPVNCLYTPGQVLYALELCETKLLVTQERYVWDKDTDKPSCLLEMLLEKFPKLKIVVMHDAKRFESNKPRMGQGYPGTYTWNKLKQFVQPYHHVVCRTLDDPFQLICTSGTTGKPKAVVQHSGMIEPNIRDLIKTYGMTGNDRSLLVNRLFHVNAQMTNFFPMVFLGGTVILGSGEPQEILKTVSERHITFSSMIPPTLKAILKYYEVNGKKIPSKDSHPHMRFIIVGADILDAELHKKFMHSTGIRIPPGWGMTESNCWGSGTAFWDAVMWGSIGKPLGHTELRVIDIKTGKEAVHSVKGELYIRGDNIFREYFKNPEATEKSFVDLDGDVRLWFKTGDICYRDARGTYYFCYRASADSWKVRGEFVQGPSIDECIKKYPAVDDAVAVPVTIDGETETALCVVTNAPAGEILAICESARASGKIEKHIKIKEVVFVPAIELGDTGKKSRKKMAELAQNYIDQKK